MRKGELLTIDLCFHPVGQGLFASGQIQSLDRATRFNWVYDCGTSSSSTLVSDAIFQLKSAVCCEHLDLVTISHFDHDHVSGLVELLRTFKIKTLLLPYMPLWHRLYCAFVEGVDSQDALMGLFIDPVAYVLALEGSDKIEQIVLVPPGTEPPAPAGEGAVPIEGGGVPVDFDFGDKPTDIGKGLAQLKSLKPNGKIQLRGVWEFVPYNDAKFEPENASAFRKKVEDVADMLLNTSDNEERNKAVKQLKNLFGEEFGKTGFKKNVISLFLYGGPVGTVQSLMSLSQTSNYTWPVPRIFWHELAYFVNEQHEWWNNQFDRQRVGFLMTGDGYLDTPERLQALVDYLEPHGRLSRSSVLQVMHHGSKKNWHHGVASSLSPDFSVFSSDPRRKKNGHPNREVVDDFVCYGPQQVDCRRGFSVNALLWKGK